MNSMENRLNKMLKKYELYIRQLTPHGECCYYVVSRYNLEPIIDIFTHKRDPHYSYKARFDSSNLEHLVYGIDGLVDSLDQYIYKNKNKLNVKCIEGDKIET